MMFKMLLVAVLSFCIVNSSIKVAAQANSPAPRLVIAPGNAPRPSPVPKTNYIYNMTWSPKEQNAFKDIIQEWSKTNADINSLLTGWSETDVNPCGHVWEGIVCSIVNSDVTYDNITGIKTVCSYISVIGLSITNTDLVGALPPAIVNLSYLITIVITGNPGLSGPIPKELSNLKYLQILDLHGNNFNGRIPMEIGGIQYLIILDLSQNNLTGPIPSTLDNLYYLNSLTLSHNRLNGSIPGYNNDSLGLGNLPYLSSLYLMENMLIGGLPNFRNIPGLQYVNVSHNQLSGPVVLDSHFNVSAQRPLLALDLSFNSFTGPIPDLAILSNKLQQLYLSHNQFNSTTVPSWLSNFTELKALGLANINLTGTVPTFLFDRPHLLVLDLNNNDIGELNINSLTWTTNSTLQVLNLMNNNIKDVIFDKSRLTDGQTKFYLQGNPYCNNTSKDSDGRRCFCEQYCAVSPDIPSKTSSTVIAISTSVCGFLLGSVILVLVCILKRKNKNMHALLKKFEEYEVRAKRFEYNVLRTATKNFANERKLGQGAYGAVYKGILPNEAKVAVKQLFMKTQEAREDFLNEILLITNLKHRNLVALKGYSLHGQEMLLVYDYVDYCDLDKLLFHGSKNGKYTWEVVSWPARMNICLGVAQGLYYLHASSQTRIIHRDIKAKNILLDKSLNAKIADFGMARPMQDAKSETLTRPAGTIGYLAPEYVMYGQLSEKADVYSFGVLLLEIVSRNRNKDPKRPEDDIYLPTLACKLHKEERLMEVVDPKLVLENEGEVMEVRRVLETAVMCVQCFPEKRPTMFRVVAMLAGNSDLPSDPIDSPIFPWPGSHTGSDSHDDPLLMLSSSRKSANVRNRSVSIELSSTYQMSLLDGDKS